MSAWDRGPADFEQARRADVVRILAALIVRGVIEGASYTDLACDQYEVTQKEIERRCQEQHERVTTLSGDGPR